MKTTLLQLEPHDDLVSIRDRMDWAKTPRVLLVWPKRGRVGVRPLDLALLRRHAAGLGAQLGLVTRVGEMRAAAAALGIPCFRNVKDAQKKPWPDDLLAVRPMRRFPRSDLRAAREALPHLNPLEIRRKPLLRLGAFALGVLSLLAVMLVFIPSAEIRLTPPEQPQRVVLSVSAAPDVKTVQLFGAVPMQRLAQTLEIDGTALGTGQLTVPDQTAQGMVQLTNRTRATVIVPAQTVLLTRTDPPVAFVTVEQAEIPAGKKTSVNIPVQAVQAGSRGNVPAGAVSAFEGPLGLSVEVTNLQPITGGSDKTLTTPTPADFDFLRARLLADLERSARARFAAQVTGQDVLLPSTFQLERVFDETAFPAPGQPGEKLSLAFKAEFSMSYVRAADLERLAGLALDASLPPGSLPVPETLTWQSQPPLLETASGVRWQVRAERQVRPAIDSGQVISLVTGQTARRAGGLLMQTFGLVESPQIRIRPGWWPWLPFLPMQIRVAG
ncbi:MAG: hypothetical protein Fur0016_24490 [Anaerolineales bacterium]